MTIRLTHHRDFTEVEWLRLHNAIPKFMMYLAINQLEKPRSLSINRAVITLRHDTRPWRIVTKTAQKGTEYEVPDVETYTSYEAILKGLEGYKRRYTYMPRLLSMIELIAPGTISPEDRKYIKESYEALSKSYEKLKHFIPEVKEPLPAIEVGKLADPPFKVFKT